MTKWQYSYLTWYNIILYFFHLFARNQSPVIRSIRYRADSIGAKYNTIIFSFFQEVEFCSWRRPRFVMARCIPSSLSGCDSPFSRWHAESGKGANGRNAGNTNGIDIIFRSSRSISSLSLSSSPSKPSLFSFSLRENSQSFLFFFSGSRPDVRPPFSWCRVSLVFVADARSSRQLPPAHARITASFASSVGW